jgi:hypothetical protein
LATNTLENINALSTDGTHRSVLPSDYTPASGPMMSVQTQTDDGQARADFVLLVD